DGPRRESTLEQLAELEPAFKPGGKVTAGNSCPLNDGAAAVVVLSDTRARELGIRPRARIIASSVSGVAPEIMGVGPIEAVRRVLSQAGMTIEDVDVVELNEAFASQVLAVARELGIDPFGEKLNPHGGAIALGHPYGMTGARIMGTLLNDLQTRGTGLSPVPDEPYDVHDLAADAAEILGGRPAHVVGFSMGGYVALTLALAEPPLVRSLVLAGTGAGGPGRVPRSPEVREAFE